MGWGTGGWGQAGWGRGVFTVAPAVELASAQDIPNAPRTLGVVAVATGAALDFTAATQAYLARAIETASAGNDRTSLFGSVNFTITERASALDRVFAQFNAAVSVTELAAAFDRAQAGGVINFTLVERAMVHEAGAFAEHIMNTLIREQMSIGHEMIGLPVFWGQMIETAGAQATTSTLAELLARTIERADAEDFNDPSGSVYGFEVAERVYADDEADLGVVRHIAVIETVSMRDAGAAVTDLWVPVNDSAPGIWVPVNDNPTGPWVPVV